ncbi:MAG TPA: FG-GAP-like repeat-containing protein [Chloroflexota bacterium]|nr:FG-GAP-like repeat-containing protein [Chloroflexota bacterium]
MTRVARITLGLPTPGLPLVALAVLLPLLLAALPPGPPRALAVRSTPPPPAAQLTAADVAALRAQVAAEQRRLEPTAVGWEVAHGEQGLRYRFAAEGLQVTPLAGAAWHWGVRAVALGREETVWALEDAAPQRVGAGVRYARGALVEWYAVRAEGVEQGFTVGAAPEGAGPLRVVLRVATELAGEAEGPTGAVWRDGAGAAVVAYRGVRAWDATGRELAAWVELGAAELAVVVEDAAAVYPVTIDPLVQQAQLTAGLAAGDSLGQSVALSADGSTALVGAYLADLPGKPNAGAAYVFGRRGTLWSVAALTASDAAASDNFGISVALSADGSTALVGAYGADLPGKPNAGAAYVFVRSGSSWSQQAKLTAGDAAAGDYFGGSVALSADGSTALVGAYHADLPGQADAGAAYVFGRSGTTWSQQAKLVAADAATGVSLGSSVALSADGSTALVGADGADQPGKQDTGAAYVFGRSGTTWSQQAKLTASDAATGDGFGIRVALSADGTIALVGAYHADLSGKTNAGAAYGFVRSGSSWSQQQKLTAAGGAGRDEFGRSVALSADGTTALVGAYGTDLLPGKTDAGAAYGFVGCQASALPAARRAVDYDGNWRADFALWRPSTQVWWVRGAVPQVQFALPWGASGDVPVRGDYDGDGCADLMIWRPSTGQWWRRNRLTGVGSVAAVWGQSGDVVVPGDYDGDGKADIAVWRPSTGEWWVRSSATGTGGVAAVWGQSSDVVVPGDYDGDGKTDIAVWRPSTGEWWVRYSSLGYAGGVAAVWGQSGDQPLAQTPP